MPGTFGKTLLAEQLLNGALRHWPQMHLTKTRVGTRLHVTTRDFVQRYIYIYGIWEPNLTHWLSRRLSPGDVFIDVGANVGYFTLLAARLVGPSGRVVAVEASPELFAELAANLSLNSCTNVRALNVAASDSSGRMALYRRSLGQLGETTTVRLNEDERPDFEVEAQPLSDLLSEGEILQARAIKIDVEGAEYAVIQGLVGLLPSMRDEVELIVEVNPELLFLQGRSADQIVSSLKAYGFHVYRLANDYRASSHVRWRRPVPAKRWRQPITEESDLVFSRVDTQSL
jgi:FkbM family methyltransferase